MSRPFFATNRPSGLLVWPSKLPGFVTMGQGGAFGSLACHFLAASLSASDVGRKPQPVRSFPLNKLTKARLERELVRLRFQKAESRKDGTQRGGPFGVTRSVRMEEIGKFRRIGVAVRV